MSRRYVPSAWMDGGGDRLGRWLVVRRHLAREGRFPAAGYGWELSAVWVVCTQLPDADVVTDQLLVKVPKGGGPLVSGIYPEWMFELRGALQVGVWPDD